MPSGDEKLKGETYLCRHIWCFRADRFFQKAEEKGIIMGT